MSAPSASPVFIEPPGDLRAAVAELSQCERDILDAINQRVAARESLADVIDLLFRETRSISPCDRIGLALLEDENRRIVAHYATADYEPILLKKGYAEDLNSTSLADVIERNVVRIIGNLPAYLRDHPGSRATAILVKEGVQASMTCPLFVEGRIAGVLFRSSRQPHVYDQRQATLHLAVAERLSQAVEKAWRIEQLSRARQDYLELLGFVSHELKSPLASMISNANLLLEGYVGRLDEEQAAKVQRIAHKGEYLLGLLRQYLDLARLEGDEFRLRARDGVDVMEDVIGPVREIVQPHIDAKGMIVREEVTGGVPKIACNPEMLRIVMVNLLDNAAKYGHEGGDLRIFVSPEATGVKVAVRNDGPGFPRSERDKLFRKFSRLETPELIRRKGTGLGLYNCWRIVNAHGGRMFAESEEGRWAEFGFILPLAPSAA